MEKLVHLACKYSLECLDFCKSTDCEIFGRIKERLQKFSEDVSRGVAGKEIIIAELRKEEWYKVAVRELHWNGFVAENNAFKKIEEELINRLLGLWAQK